MTPRLNRWIVIVLLALAIPWYWLFIENDTGAARPKPVSIAGLRSLAEAGNGKPPQRIRYEVPGHYERMGNMIAAGTGMRINRLSVFSYLLEFGDRPPIVIGSGIAPGQVSGLKIKSYSGKAQDRIAASLGRAQMLILLDEGPMQTGGLEAMERGAARKRLDDAIARMERLDSAGMPYALAPGVVAVPTTSRQRGSRLVYVRTAGGREYLFAGDLARQKENWTELRAPSALFGTREGKDSRQETYSWLMTLQKLKDEAPNLIIVSGGLFPRGSGIERYFPEPSRE